MVDYDSAGEGTQPSFCLVILDMCNYTIGLCRSKGRRSTFVYLQTATKNRDKPNEWKSVDVLR